MPPPQKNDDWDEDDWEEEDLTDYVSPLKPASFTLDSTPHVELTISLPPSSSPMFLLFLPLPSHPIQKNKSSKDSILICLDASASMQRPLKRDVDEDEEEEEEDQPSYFQGALQCVFEIQKRKALKNPSDLLGILVYNTVSSYSHSCGGPCSGEAKGRMESVRAHLSVFG